VETLNHGLYINVPYCHQFCTFCKYRHQIANDQTKDYHKHLIDVITANRDQLKSFDELYFGGGTPTTLSALQLSKVMDALWFVDIEKKCSEGSPSTITSDHIKFWKDYKFDYISMGVQTFNRRILKKINRKYTQLTEINNIIDSLQSDNIIVNIDLICGLGSGDERDVPDFIRDMNIATEILRPHSITVHIDYDHNGHLIRQALLKALTSEYNGYICVNHDMSTKHYNMYTDIKHKAEYKFMNKHHDFYHRQTGALPYTPEYKWKTQNIFEDSMDLRERSLDDKPQYMIQKAREAYEITKGHRDLLGLPYY